jgi:hypothetical protein
MTKDNIETRWLYQLVYCRCPIEFILYDLKMLDKVISKMSSDEMIEVRELMDEKIPLWK